MYSNRLIFHNFEFVCKKSIDVLKLYAMHQSMEYSLSENAAYIKVSPRKMT
jgi:hypothetical protein